MIKPFVPKLPFLYPLKTSENLGFLKFSWGREGCIGNKWVNLSIKSLISGESGGSFVLISHDGVQLPPLSFPSSGSLLSFISCLEQGLLPEGRLDPPLMNTSSNLINWPKFKKTLLPDKLMNHLDLDKKSEKVEHDYVFRILSGTTSQIGKLFYDIL